MVKIGNRTVNVRPLIGSPFGSIFAIDKNTLKPTDLTDEQLKELFATKGIEGGDSDEMKDNRFIVDDGKSQKLSKDDIETLKEEGLSGKEIIETLVENSSSFKSRTQFSQEKYLKKKHLKYSNFVRVYEPNPALLMEMYYAQNPFKTNYLRIDTLSQMLAHCNVQSGSKYMVVDTGMGIVTAAVVERLVGNGDLVSAGLFPGVCVQVIAEQGPVTTWRQSVDALNLSPQALESCLCSLQINKVRSILHDNEKQIMEDKNDESDTKEGVCESKRQKLDEKSERKAKRMREEEIARNIMREKSMDGLLIVTRQHDPKNLMNLLIQFLAPSRPLAIFCCFMEPLVQCYQSLKDKAVFARISETWLRRFQVLPGRTRPDVNMSSSGGYLLTAIKVNSD
ncbi:tRNA (adenine(58)-N(1))-methyltransferase non-catalytic subunit TRM6-like protein [Leptotrombidium deliense]|uniref:tRNA (adenine(58)-N(1))-methyltransferase non-catalytic subunit TRM6 n=1 Tax=Leptotrombidium deliense TaxID=299467 RepID=A0A443ST46_9ACAR|nr:tRNA (adenine(58)-N(1))-methyltransferase non-catalytic subunit TRM6-like protein [Leptotrombidium deliense]